MLINFQILVPFIWFLGVNCDFNVHRRFEYKYSFKAPYLAQKNGLVPFWTYSGNAIASSESMRITPSLRSQKGQSWSKYITSFDWWEVEIIFRINGRGRVGADGLAFWYTTQPGVEGPVFGSADKWNGLGLFFDSFDNDNKRNNPYISFMNNDGSQAYDHENDGMSQALGGCLRDYRNKPHPVRAKIEYYKNTITLMVHNGLTNSDKDFEMCARVENVVLPQRGYFGLSAATGGLADDHDVLKFLVTSIRGKDEMGTLDSNREEEERFQQEFREYQDKTKKAKEEYVKEHPDAKIHGDDDDDDDFDMGEIKEYRQLLQGQDKIHDVIRKLNSKLDEILGRQERTLSLVGAVHSAQSTGGGGIPLATPQMGGAVPQGGGASPMARFEVDQLLNTQREIAQTAREVKNVVTDINQKSSQILSKPTGTATPVGGAYDIQKTLRELSDNLSHIKQSVGSSPQKALPDCPACVGVSMVVGVAVVQCVVLLGYMLNRDRKDSQAKKFY